MAKKYRKNIVQQTRGFLKSALADLQPETAPQTLKRIETIASDAQALLAKVDNDTQMFLPFEDPS
jgi:hypothetical protein